MIGIEGRHEASIGIMERRIGGSLNSLRPETIGRGLGRHVGMVMVAGLSLLPLVPRALRTPIDVTLQVGEREVPDRESLRRGCRPGA